MDAGPMELRKIVEALLFASPEPITAKELVRTIRAGLKEARKVEREERGEVGEDAGPEDEAAEEAVETDEEAAEEGEKEPEEGVTAVLEGKVNEKTVTETLEALEAFYREGGAAITVVEGPEGWKHYTRPDMVMWVRHLFPARKAERLSAPALETLAIIAYRQPITKADIEAVRGVSVDGVMQKVLDRGLVCIGGKADLPGRPLLYETTELFLERFGIKDLEDLPNAAELKRVQLPTAPVEGEVGGEEPGAEKQMTFGEAGASADAGSEGVEEAEGELEMTKEQSPDVAVVEAVEES
jgi:segregation and condensation protein B